MQFFCENVFWFSRNDFSYDRSNMQIFTVNIIRVVWPHVTIPLDLRHFCQRNPLFYHLNLIPCHYWSWKRNIFFLVNIFVRHTFPMSTSSIKTKTVLTMTDMTESTKLQAFKRQRDGYIVTVKISLCIYVVLSWDELKFRQNLPDSDYEIYMVCLLVATVNWHKSLQSAKKSNIALLFMILLAVSMITLIMLYQILARLEFQFLYFLYLNISVAWQAWHRNSKMSQPPKYQEMSFFPLRMTSRKTFQESLHSEN